MYVVMLYWDHCCVTVLNVNCGLLLCNVCCDALLGPLLSYCVNVSGGLFVCNVLCDASLGPLLSYCVQCKL